MHIWQAHQPLHNKPRFRGVPALSWEQPEDIFPALHQGDYRVQRHWADEGGNLRTFTSSNMLERKQAERNGRAYSKNHKNSRLNADRLPWQAYFSSLIFATSFPTTLRLTSEFFPAGRQEPPISTNKMTLFVHLSLTFPRMQYPWKELYTVLKLYYTCLD